MIDLAFRLPPFNVRVRSDFSSVADHVADLYPALQRLDSDSFVDFDIRILRGKGHRRWLGQQARFLLDAQEPFLPLPGSQAPALLEWGLNWSIAARPLGYLVLHAAVLARGTDAVVMPGFPGAGKSTLCASLAFLGGWRLLSDELAILDPGTLALHPNPRPISVKNESIDIVGRFPGAAVGPVYHDTRKGRLSHLAPPRESALAAEETARCRWIVFPSFQRDDEHGWHEEISRAEAFALISEQSFNKERMGEQGFHALCGMLDGARCFQIGYGSTAAGLELIDRLCR
ncbi:HprK-related kinase A [Azoarcus olearius]|uniref:HprK-related kinase A n=1 Tax=Azoarcus sp. (strain BH72) TaxID=418699 RepID=A1K447_AZOSB|nr:HprK-related kinase A [Azoarcus olearius]CAL93602.1 conserved hypothetical protein [Azoarcus olearius]